MKRAGFLALGWCLVALGFVRAFLPVLPDALPHPGRSLLRTLLAPAEAGS